LRADGINGKIYLTGGISSEKNSNFIDLCSARFFFVRLRLVRKRIVVGANLIRTASFIYDDKFTNGFQRKAAFCGLEQV
jgi:hypothetical protein